MPRGVRRGAERRRARRRLAQSHPDPALEVGAVVGVFGDAEHPSAVVVDQRAAQPRETAGGGFVVAPVAPLTEHPHQSSVAATGQGVRRVDARVDEHPPGPGRNRLGDAVPEQHAGQQPLEQRGLIARFHGESQIPCSQMPAHAETP